ncbi:hypothetical protein Tco_0144834 [Tanacetum coccineum]
MLLSYGDFPPTENNPKTKKDEIVPFDKQSDDLKKRLARNNEANMTYGVKKPTAGSGGEHEKGERKIEGGS